MQYVHSCLRVETLIKILNGYPVIIKSKFSKIIVSGNHTKTSGNYHSNIGEVERMVLGYLGIPTHGSD
jgi:hypothetical protein